MKYLILLFLMGCGDTYFNHTTEIKEYGCILPDGEEKNTTIDTKYSSIVNPMLGPVKVIACLYIDDKCYLKYGDGTSKEVPCVVRKSQ